MGISDLQNCSCTSAHTTTLALNRLWKALPWCAATAYSTAQYGRCDISIPSTLSIDNMPRNMSDTCVQVYRLQILVDCVVESDLYPSSFFFRFSDCSKLVTVSLCWIFEQRCKTSLQLMLYHCLPLPQFLILLTCVLFVLPSPLSLV